VKNDSKGSSPALEMIEFFAALDPARLDRAVADQARRCVLDSLGCGLFGALQPWGKLMAEAVLEESRPGPCTLYARSEKLAPFAAALANGTATHGFELDDLISESLVHPGAVVVPAALAAAERVQASGARLLAGVAAGYEAMSRVSLAIGLESVRRGFHTTAVAGPIAAAVAAGVVQGVPSSTLVAAVGLTCSMSSGIKSFAGGSGGGMVKRMHAGRAAEGGVRACDLASRGFTGPSRALDGHLGLLEVFGGAGAMPARLSEGLGTRWAIDNVWVKVYPICGWIQGVVQLLGRLRGDGPLDPKQVKAIRIGTSRHAVAHNADPAPTDTMSAQYSIPYCAALAVTGDARDPESFSDRAVSDPALRALASRVTLHVDEKAEAVYPRQFGSNVELVLDDGKVRNASVYDPHGTPADPCDDAEHEAKFRRLAGACLPAASVENVLDAVRRLSELPDVRSLSKSLAA